MKIKYFEFFFVIVMITFCYLAFLTDLPSRWKVLCATFYGIIIFYTVITLWLENHSGTKHTFMDVHFSVIACIRLYLLCILRSITIQRRNRSPLNCN